VLVANQARVAVYHAIAAARRRHTAVVDTTDLLTGVIASRDVVVRMVWQELGVDPAALGAVVAMSMRAPVPPRRRVVALRPTAFSADARRVLRHAFMHARQHHARVLGAGHLLLAITAQDTDDGVRSLLSALDIDGMALARALCRRLTASQRSYDYDSHACGAAVSSRGRSGSR
jgi:ATP-dependent Clp protease ATP-binding subunit ClpA